MPPELPPTSSCRACPARIRWVDRLRGGRIPLEVEPDGQGPWVIDQDPQFGRVAVLFVAQLHGTMPRYRSHLDRCRPRPESPSMPAVKPDSTAGMKFPKRPPPARGQVGPFPPLAEVERRVRLSRSPWGAQTGEVPNG